MAQPPYIPPYMMVRGKPVYIKEIHGVESQLFENISMYHGEFPDVKVKSRCLEKALEFCEKRGDLRKKDSSPASLTDFDRDFLQDVRESDLNLIDLFHAAGMLEIRNLINLLFDDVFCIICSMSPEQVEKIFKVRYNGHDDAKLLNICLNCAPPCPTLSKREQEEVNLNREQILKVSPADFKNQSPTHKLYWVYAHFVFKQFEYAAQDEEDEEDESKESKVPKINHDDLGGPGPRGVTWKTKKTTR